MYTIKFLDASMYTLTSLLFDNMDTVKFLFISVYTSVLNGGENVVYVYIAACCMCFSVNVIRALSVLLPRLYADVIAL